MAIPVFDVNSLEQICNILGETDGGLTGNEIGQMLSRLKVRDDSPDTTKRRRLLHALAQRQAKDGVGTIVGAFIQQALDPVRFTGQSERFDSMRGGLNCVLAFTGLNVGEDGKLRAIAAARTLTEAQERASQLQAELTRRNVHPDVLRFCREELLHENYFHAVFEATKSVADKIRSLSGLAGDGSELVDHAFGLGKSTYPLLAFNTLATPTEQGEHRGFMNLVKGMFGAFRNVTAHTPKVHWPISQQDALDLMTLASMLHRRLDSTVRTHVPM